MSDFRDMFPNMDEEVIEAVLRANNGAVDETIDQLLTMNSNETPTDTDTDNLTETPQTGEKCHYFNLPANNVL